MYRRALLLIMAVVLPASALVGAFPQTVNADGTPTPYLAPGILSNAKTTGEAESLAICLEYNRARALKEYDVRSGYGALTPQQVSEGKWFNDNTQYRMWNSYFDGGLGCDNLDVNKALADIGWTSKIQAACDLGMVRVDKSDCVTGNGNVRYNGGDKGDVMDRIFKVYKGGYFDAPKNYVRFMDMFLQDKVCKATPIALASAATPDQKNLKDAEVTVVGSDGVASQVYYKINGDKGKKWAIGFKSQGSTDFVQEKCSWIAQQINDNANAYAQWVRANQPGSANNPGTCEQYATLQVGGPGAATGDQKEVYNKLLTACNDGMANKSTPNYCTDHYKVQNEIDACLYGYSGKALPSTPAGGTTDTPTASDKPTCGIQGIGWLICPAMTFMSTAADMAFNFIASFFLTIDPKLVSDPQTKAAWDQFRNIANVVFVIALLFIIYSQVTSFGVSSYGIKRMLPRILVGALLVNLSYYICSAAVDLSNLLGYAIPQLFAQIPIGAGLPDGAGSKLGWAAVIGVVIVGAVGIALAISIPVLIAALLAIVLIAFILIARQALIVLLIVISPLAFVAYLLPNTEQWFKKWYKMFFTLLMLFPVIGVVFAGSKLASQVLASVGSGSGDNTTQIIALGVQAIPFFIVPGLLKGSLNAAGAIGSKFQNAANKATGKIGSQSKNTSRLGAGMADMKRFREQQQAIKLAKGRGKGGVLGTPLNAVGRIAGGKAYNEKARLRGEDLENKEYEEDVRAAMDSQSRHMTYAQKMRWAQGQQMDVDENGQPTGAKPSDTERDAAIRFMMESGNFTERQQVLSSVGSMSGGLRRSAINGARKKGDTGVYGSRTLGDLEDTSGAKPGSATGQDVNAVQAILNQGTTSRINSGDLAPETFTRDAYTAGYVAQQAKNADGEAQTQLAQSLTNYAASDQGKKTAASLQGHIDTVVNNAPAGSVQPAPATPIAPAGPPPAPQPQNTTLNVPHGGNQPPAPPPPGMTQRASGLFVPNGANNTPPPPPPPSNP